MTAGRPRGDRRSRVAVAFRTALDTLCFVLLALTMGTVIWGMVLRSIYEKSYLAGALVAILGAVVVIVALAQQAIAGRDRATWREMAVWQIRSATQKLEAKGIHRSAAFEELLGGENTPYYEHLIETLIEDMGREERGLDLDAREEREMALDQGKGPGDAG